MRTAPKKTACFFFRTYTDIILTVAIDPTIESPAVLGLIVLIRTFLSFPLEVEIKGYWPRQEASIQYFKKLSGTDHQNS